MHCKQLTRKKHFQTEEKKWFLVKDVNISDNFYKAQNFNRSPAEKVLFIIIFRLKYKEKHNIFSPTPSSGPSWSSSHKVCVFVCVLESTSILISISSRALKMGMCAGVNQVSIFAWTESVLWCGSVVSSRALKRGCVPDVPPP